MMRAQSWRGGAACTSAQLAGAVLAVAGVLAGCGSAARHTATTAAEPAASSQPSPQLATPAQAPFAAVRWIRVPGGASQAVTGGGALFTGSAANPSSPGANILVTRVDLATGRVGPATTIGGASGMAFGGGLLWVGRGAQPTSADMTVVALDPVTLAVRYTVALAQPPSFGTEQLAYAGGLVWVVTEETLIAIDPATAHAVADVPLPGANAQDFVHVAGSADGGALWTTVDSGGGSPISVQQRNPRTGAVLATASAPVVGLGGAQIAAAGTHAWLAYATGMAGGYFQAVSAAAGQLTEIRPPPGPIGFTNSVRVYLVGQQLWITDAMTGTIACASSTTGRILAVVRRNGLLPAGIEPATRGRLALLLNSEILLARPKRACGP